MHFRIILISSLLTMLNGCDNAGKSTQSAPSTQSTLSKQGAPNKALPNPEHFDLYNTPLGRVDFPTNCNEKADPLITRGTALLHHMMYDEAKFFFLLAAKEDSQCVFAYWGKSDDANSPTLARTPHKK